MSKIEILHGLASEDDLERERTIKGLGVLPEQVNALMDGIANLDRQLKELQIAVGELSRRLPETPQTPPEARRQAMSQREFDRLSWAFLVGMVVGIVTSLGAGLLFRPRPPVGAEGRPAQVVPVTPPSTTPKSTNESRQRRQ